MRIRALGLSVLAAIAVAWGSLGSVAAQDASPEAGGGLAGAGFPELSITLTDAGVEGLAAETTAGWNLVNFANNVTPAGDPFEDAWSVDFILLPDGMTAEDVAAAFNAAFAGPPPGEGEASPAAMEGMDMASPAAGAAPEDPLAFVYETSVAGGPGALQGETGQAALYLTPGDYAVLVAGFGAPATITVTGEADAASPVASGVTADATITETGTSGSFDFVAASLPEGAGVIEIVNESDQPHFILGVRSDVPFTDEEVIALLSEEPPADGASPEAGAGGPPPIEPGFITGSQSAGTTQYIAVDLEPGYYILLCFIGDPLMGGVPHSFAGMIEVVPAGV